MSIRLPTLTRSYPTLLDQIQSDLDTMESRSDGQNCAPRRTLSARPRRLLDGRVVRANHVLTIIAAPTIVGAGTTAPPPLGRMDRRAPARPQPPARSPLPALRASRKRCVATPP